MAQSLSPTLPPASRLSPSTPPPVTGPSTVASSRMAAVASPSNPAPLVGAAPDFDQMLKRAETTLLKGNDKEALSQFQTIFSLIQEARLPKTSFDFVRCHLGLALSCPAGEDQNRHAMNACTALLTIWASRNTVKTEISPFYSTLRWHLKKLKPLMSVFDQSLAAIDDKIKECGNHILKIDAFKELVEEGDELRIKQDKRCRKIYEQALELIKDETGVEFQVARVRCLLRLTSSHNKESVDFSEHYARTQKALFDLYGCSDAIPKSIGCAEVVALTALNGYLTQLLGLTPSTDSTNRKAIQQKIDACTIKLTALSEPKNFASTPDATQDLTAATILSDQPTPGPTSQPTTPAISERPPRKVTRGAPGVYNKLEGIFISCIVIALVAFAGIALYQRSTVTVSK